MMHSPSFTKQETYFEFASCTPTLYEKASQDLAFLKKQIVKMGKDHKEWVSPFTSVDYEYTGNRDNAAYRQQYLRMYNPLKKMKKESVKQKSKKMFIKLKHKAFQSKDIDDRFIAQSTNYNSSSAFSITVKSFLKFFHSWDSNQVTKKPTVTPFDQIPYSVPLFVL